MKRLLLYTAFISAMFSVRASDTLTIRQVFNFNVGDTFDYKETSANYAMPHFDTTYSRVTIFEKHYSPLMDTLFINNGWIITNLDSPVISLADTAHAITVAYYYGDLTSWPGQVSNRTRVSFFENGYSDIYTEGLGKTYHESYSANNPNGLADNAIKQLIYYYHNGQSYGTPYYTLTSSDDLSSSNATLVYSNPATNLLQVSLTESISQKLTLSLTNLIGQICFSTPIIESRTTYDISTLLSGIYVWQLKANNTIIKTGKVVKQ